MGRFLVFHDEKGKAVGVGEEIKIARDLGNGVKELQTITLANGTSTDYTTEIAEQTAKDIRNPKKNLALQDFNKEPFDSKKADQ